ncbi:MAG TPA: arsinothricin resistance N-acetyltransferase ArsN1 family A [Thermoleophilaceae bacterium]|nr:arsinothricin resistance N-acetyltransferase ArsN1 family A [Thermoleophilaceae bacterium]
MSTTVRSALPADAAAIAAIWNEGIEERSATFETRLREPADCEPLLHRALVAERGGRVVAWAAALPYSERECYAGVAEISVYVERDERGAGTGTRLLERLCAWAEERGLWKLVSKLFPENRASLALVSRSGFRVVGLHLRHARLDGDWRDVLVVERLLGEAAG